MGGGHEERKGMRGEQPLYYRRGQLTRRERIREPEGKEKGERYEGDRDEQSEHKGNSGGRNITRGKGRQWKHMGEYGKYRGQ